MTRARSLTPAGLERARAFLAETREHPTVDAEPPDEILFDGIHTERIPNAPDLRRQPFVTRRDAARYLHSVLVPIQRQVADHAGFWSWLGMYYFAQTAPRDSEGVLRLSKLDETLVVHDGEQQSYQRRYRHYLWSAWRLAQAHPDADYLLDEPINSFRDIADRVFSSSRVFNSVGVVQLILTLYTDHGEHKRGFGHGPGGLRHLFRVLDQLERTYDVYGMKSDALMELLPPEFDSWKPTMAP